MNNTNLTKTLSAVAFFILFLFPTHVLPAEPEAELAQIQAQRQAVMKDYQIGQLMMQNAVLQDKELKARQDVLEAQIKAKAKVETKAKTKSEQ